MYNSTYEIYFLDIMTSNDYQIFSDWLQNCLYGEVGDHLDSMASLENVNVDEKTQLSWFDNQQWFKILGYKGNWSKTALLRYLQETPEDVLLHYLPYYTLNEHEQLALILRDMHNGRHALTREYFHINYACEMAQRLLQKYDPELWPEMIMRNYGWEYEFEQKFGCLKNWQNVLKQNTSQLMECDVAKIPTLLRKLS